MRILLRGGVQFREISDVVRDIYVRVAFDELAEDGKPASLARVAIVTGLTRKEITSIVESEDKLRKALESNARALARLLQGWHNDPAYMGPYSFPRDLHFDTGSVDVTTFEDLVNTYAPGLPPRVLLEELLGVKAAEFVTETGMIRVLKRTFIPEEMAPEAIEVFARGVRRYIETINHNLSEKDPKRRRFERWVFPDSGISEADWEQFRNLVHERLKGVIEDLDIRFGDFKAPDTAHESVSVGVGMYLYRDEDDDGRLFEVKSVK